jgi:hypothetical protein
MWRIGRRGGQIAARLAHEIRLQHQRPTTACPADLHQFVATIITNVPEVRKLEKH